MVISNFAVLHTEKLAFQTAQLSPDKTFVALQMIRFFFFLCRFLEKKTKQNKKTKTKQKKNKKTTERQEITSCLIIFPTYQPYFIHLVFR